jgi:hypothetical protein
MLEGLGAILIIVGFVLGVYCGVLLSLPRVVKNENGEIRQGKLNGITIACVLSVILIYVGQTMFFHFNFY